MKKISVLFAAAAVAFGFAGCTKAEFANDSRDVVSNYSLFARITKTTNDGPSTLWAANDSISVFHAEAGTTEYGANDKFIISESGLDEGQFVGTLSGELAASNDWYAIYPFKRGVTDPTGAGEKNYFNLGSYSRSTPQKQAGNNSTAHLAGQYYPLWAQAKKVASTDKVELDFIPIVGVVQFHVTNNSNAPLTVISAAVTAQQEDIFGSYYINFSGSAPVLEKSGDTYVSNKDSLVVSDGSAIPVGESADFYMAIKPFDNAAGNKLTFSVNGYGKSTTEAYSFKAGKIKTVNFSYDKEVKVLQAGTYVALVNKSDTNYYAMSSTNQGASTNRFMSKDVVYKGGATFETADGSLVWNVTKEEGEEKGYLFENGGKYISWVSGNSAVMSENKYYLDVASQGDCFKVKSVADGTRVLARNTNGAYFAFYTGSGYGDFTFVPATQITTPVINPITDPEKVAAAGATGVEVSYTVLNPVEGKSVSAASADTWVHDFDYTTSGKIKFTVDANTVTDDRSTVVTVSYEGAEYVTFTVSQGAAGTIEPIVLDFSGKDVNHNAYYDTWKYGDWSITYGANSNGAWGYVKLGAKQKNLNNPCTIAYSKQVTDKITEITVHIPAGSLSKEGMSVTSWGVFIYSDANMTTEVDNVAGGTITKDEGNFSFKPSEGKIWKDCYVIVKWTLANTTSYNGIVCVDKVTIKF